MTTPINPAATPTPGPWALTIHTGDGKRIGPRSDWSVAGPSGIAICFEGQDNPNADADARLIAAAPELYEALERAAALIGGPSSFAGLSSDDEVEHTVRVRIDDVIRFRAALAKARGQ